MLAWSVFSTAPLRLGSAAVPVLAPGDISSKRATHKTTSAKTMHNAREGRRGA